MKYVLRTFLSLIFGRLWRMNPFGASASNVKPPEKGSFPLDRQGKCKEHATKFLSCIQEHQRDYGACKELSKAYLQCRMDEGLMQQEDLSKLGFREAEPQAQQRKRAERTREKEGFVAGTGVKTGRTGFFS